MFMNEQKKHDTEVQQRAQSIDTACCVAPACDANAAASIHKQSATTLCFLKHSSDRLIVFPADHLQPHVRRRIDQHALGLQSDCKLGVRSTALRCDFLLIDFCDFQRINVEITPFFLQFHREIMRK